MNDENPTYDDPSEAKKLGHQPESHEITEDSGSSDSVDVNVSAQPQEAEPAGVDVAVSNPDEGAADVNVSVDNGSDSSSDEG